MSALHYTIHEEFVFISHYIDNNDKGTNLCLKFILILNTQYIFYNMRYKIL